MSQGRQLEIYIDRVNSAALTAGIAHVFKVPTPMVIKRRMGDGKVMARLDKVVWSDYAGTFGDGRSVAGEAKELRSTGNLTKARLAEHQKDCLGYTAEAGGIAWVWVRRILDNEIEGDYIVPVTSRVQLNSVIKLDTKYRRPAGMQWHQAAKDWQAYIKSGWEAVPREKQ